MSEAKEIKLILEDGSVFAGKSFGYHGSVSGEMVFNTAMTGYPESLTDPSYKGQILVSTYPLIGNYGVPSKEAENGIPKFYESDEIHIAGLVISEYSFGYSHWNAQKSLGDWLKEYKVPGIFGIDTRSLTQLLRENGPMLGKVVADDVDAGILDGADGGDDIAANVLVHIGADFGVAGFDAGADPVDADFFEAGEKVVEDGVDAGIDPDVEVVAAFFEEFAEAGDAGAVEHEKFVGEAEVADAVLVHQVINPADDGIHGPVLDAGLAEDGVDAAVVAVVGAVEGGVERDVGAADVEEGGIAALLEILEALPVVGPVVVEGGQQVPGVAGQFGVEVLDGARGGGADGALGGAAPEAGDGVEGGLAIQVV